MLQILTTFHCALISLLFQVESHVLIAVEGGPVLLQITLTYKGTRDILVDNISDKHYGAIPPKEWGSWLARRPHPFFIVGQTTMSIRPGAKIVCIVSP